MRRRTVFLPDQRRLIIRGLGRNDQAPIKLLLPLVQDRVLRDTYMPYRKRRLEIVLEPHDCLPPITLLRQLARIIAGRFPQYAAVYDPWTVGGRPVDIGLAVSMIGDVFRDAARSRRRTLRG